jgi:hypothetical protein
VAGGKPGERDETLGLQQQENILPLFFQMAPVE